MTDPCDSSTHTISEGQSDRADVALIFPPLTEARLFPYLSLPLLTAWLRARGRRVVPTDANIELCHALFQQRYLERKLEDLKSRPPSLAVVHRVEMLQYVLARLGAIRARVFDKEPDGPEASQHDIRFCRQTIELLLEHSLLARKVADFGEMARLVAAYDTPDPLDFATVVTEQRVKAVLARERPRILGLSIAFWSQLLPALLIARWARAFDPGIVVIFGGQQVMLWHERMREAVAPWVDGLCIGGGEACLEALCDAVDGAREREDIPNLVWLDDPAGQPVPREEVPMNALPVPDFDDLPIRGYLSEEVHLAMITCVGCYWGKCVFCSYGARNPAGGGYRQMSPDRIAATCKGLIDRYGVRRINFVDENTPIPNVVRAMRLLNAGGDSMRFSTRNRLDAVLLDARLCQELADRGCVLMSAGYETNSQRLLDRLHKGVKAEHYATIFANLHAAGIPLRLSVMGGILDETEEERAESEAFLRQHSDKIGIDIMQMLVLEPGTELWREPESFGLQVDGGAGLRGNAVLNYGMGRMGAQFTWSSGEDFDARLARFLCIFDNVDPQMNDELPPHRRRARRARRSGGETLAETAAFLPWVRVVSMQSGSGVPKNVIIDLLWQRFYEVPGDWEVREDGDRRELRHATPDGVRQLVELGLVATGTGR